jgi:hypothetical protein
MLALQHHQHDIKRSSLHAISIVRKLFVALAATTSLLTGGVTAHGPSARAIIGEADNRRAAVSTAGAATAGAATNTATVIGATVVTTTAGAATTSAGDSRSSSNNDTGVQNSEDPFEEPQGMLSCILDSNFVILYMLSAILASVAILLALHIVV